MSIKKYIFLTAVILLSALCIGCSRSEASQVYHSPEFDTPNEGTQNEELPEPSTPDKSESDETVELSGNGKTYVGEVKDGKPHGNGTYTWDDGTVYTGQWENGIACGWGTYTYPSGNVLVGRWNNGLPNGEGTLFYLSGEKLQGNWVNGQKEGSFLYIDAEGNAYDEVYENGELIRQTPSDKTFVEPTVPVEPADPPVLEPEVDKPPETRTLSGSEFLDPLSYYGLDIWDLESSRGAVLFRECVLKIRPVSENFLDEFLTDVSNINPQFVLWDERKYDYTSVNRGWQLYYYFDHIPADGSANTEHEDFVISLCDYGDRFELGWSWSEDVMLADAGLRAETVPVSLSTVTFFVPQEPCANAGRLSGTQFMDPFSYFELQETFLSVNREDARGFTALSPGKDVLAEFIANAEQLNPEFVLSYVNEIDYISTGGNYSLTYNYRYAPADGNYRGLDSQAEYHFKIGINLQLNGETHISWGWVSGVQLTDAGLRTSDMPLLAGNNTGGGSGGNGGGSFIPGDSGGNDKEHRRPCPYCMDGTEDCSRCDGDGGKWIYTSVPDYNGDGYTQKKTWQRCSKCYGTGEQDCHWCDGDEWIEY